MADELVRYEVRDRVAVVTISNGKANALSPEVISQLDAALTRAEDAGEEQVGAVLITGAPGMFSGGFDLKVMRSSAGAAGKLVTDGGELITRCFGSEIPVVIACSGHAVAAGALMLFGADERIGASGAFRIGLIETEIGLVLPQWAAEFARERLSPRQLQIATVGAKMYDPAGALEAGYLDAVVDPDLLESTALAAAGRWAKLPRGAYRGQVRMNRGAVLGRLADAIAHDRGRTFDVPA
jgi:enoyl-CoA hydratase